MKNEEFSDYVIKKEFPFIESQLNSIYVSLAKSVSANRTFWAEKQNSVML